MGSNWNAVEKDARELCLEYGDHELYVEDRLQGTQQSSLGDFEEPRYVIRYQSPMLPETEAETVDGGEFYSLDAAVDRLYDVAAQLDGD